MIAGFFFWLIVLCVVFTVIGTIIQGIVSLFTPPPPPPPAPPSEAKLKQQRIDASFAKAADTAAEILWQHFYDIQCDAVNIIYQASLAADFPEYRKYDIAEIYCEVLQKFGQEVTDSVDVHFEYYLPPYAEFVSSGRREILRH